MLPPCLLILSYSTFHKKANTDYGRPKKRITFMTETMGQEMSWSRNFIYITRMILERKKQINEKGNL